MSGFWCGVISAPAGAAKAMIRRTMRAMLRRTMSALATQRHASSYRVARHHIGSRGGRSAPSRVHVVKFTSMAVRAGGADAGQYPHQIDLALDSHLAQDRAQLSAQGGDLDAAVAGDVGELAALHQRRGQPAFG